MKALIHANLFDFETLKKEYYILFDSQIHEVGPMAQFPGAQEVFDCQGVVVMPGLVVGHAHMYSTFARGWNTSFSPKSFRQLLEQMWWKLDAVLDREAVYQSGLVSGIEYIKNGVTTVIDHHASGSIKGTLQALKEAICDQSGLRGIFCFETSDRFSIDDCIKENMEFAANQNKQHVGLFGMHAAMTLSDESLRRIANESKNLPIHIHAAESIEDQQNSQQQYQKTVVQRLEQFGLLRPQSILAHCIHLSPEEVETLSQYDVRVALNPTSNMNNGVGLPDYLLFKEKGLRCILGSDGLGYNIAREMLNFHYSMHHRYQDPTLVSIEDVKKLVQNTYDYASSRLGCFLGKLEVGYEADFITIPYSAPTPWESDNALGHFFFGMLDRFTPKEVWCGGVLRMKEYRVLQDEQDIYKEAQTIAKSVWERVRG